MGTFLLGPKPLGTGPWCSNEGKVGVKLAGRGGQSSIRSSRIAPIEAFLAGSARIEDRSEDRRKIDDPHLIKFKPSF